VYEVYESSADAAYKAAALCLSTVLVVGYNIFINFYKLLIDCNGYNIVIILVNCFSKYPFLIPYYKNIDAKEAAQLYIYYVYRIYRPLNTIISNRGPQFILAF
jgi:hypothetical protein